MAWSMFLPLVAFSGSQMSFSTRFMVSMVALEISPGLGAWASPAGVKVYTVKKRASSFL